MNISPYFRHLHSAYLSEIEDLTYDSEGLHVLNRRLTQRRKEIDFLVHMMEISPEMVATVFHKGFRFTAPAAMEHLLTLESDELPDWDSLADSIVMEPWTAELVQVVQKQAMGDWFLTVSAALEYMHSRPQHPHAEGAEGDAEPLDAQDEEEHREAKAREEAAADWMVEQGFDRKE